MSTERAAAFLARTGMFGGIAEPDLRMLAERAVVRTFGKGELVFHQGDPGDALFIVADGAVKIFVTAEDGHVLVLARLAPPDVFGELAVIDGLPRTASAQAVEPTRLISLGRPQLLAILARRPSVTDVLLRTMGGLVRRLVDQATDLTFLDLEGRVAKVLVGLSERAATGRPIELDTALTQGDLAEMAGGSRQSVNQILHSFERRGFVAMRGRSIVLSDVASLRRRAGLGPA